MCAGITIGQLSRLTGSNHVALSLQSPDDELSTLKLALMGRCPGMD
jgi:hypothetical protein